MPDLIKRIRSWSHFRQSLGRRGGSLSRVLKDVIGVYSAHPTGPLSLFCRTNSFDPKAFHALDQKQQALRIPAMRLSIHQVPRETAANIFSATVPPTGDPIWEKRYSQEGRAMPAEKYMGWKKEILGLLSEPLPAKTIKGRTSIPDEILKPALNRMAYEGLLLRVGATNLRSNLISYVSTKAWVKGKLDPVSVDKARTWLAAQYLRAFGPARVEDFKWWAGIPTAAAKKAITALKTVYLGEGFLLLASDQEAFESFKLSPKDTVDILPQWDCYTMGYAPDGRARFVDPAFQSKIYGALGATGGNALGTVLVNGEARGSWSSRFKGSQMNVALEMFEKPTTKLKADLMTRFDEIAKLLGAKSVSVNNG